MTSNSNHRGTCIAYKRPDFFMIDKTVIDSSQHKEDYNDLMPSGTRNETRISDRMINAYYAIRGKEAGYIDRNNKSGMMSDEPDDGTDMYAEATDGGIIYDDNINDGLINTAMGMKKDIGRRLLCKGNSQGTYNRILNKYYVEYPT